MQDKTISNDMLFVIPSWGLLLGYPTLGKYVNHYVSKIQSDIVIFLTGLEASVDIKISTEFETKIRTFYYLFGLGYYYTKFEIQTGRYVVDNRQLTGMILSDFVYDQLATSKDLTLETDPDVIIAEKIIKVPIDLSRKSDTQISFIKGALMRNLFIPYKDIFLEFMSVIQHPSSFQLGQGHILLSTHWDYFNQILISNQMMKDKRNEFMNPTAGINEIRLGADEFIKKIFSSSDRKSIDDSILKFKKVYSNLNYDPMYLFSIIDNASKHLISKPILSPMHPHTSNLSNTLKKSVFISANNRLNSITEWPEQFMRNTKENLEKTAIYKEYKEHPPTIKPSKLETNNIEPQPEITKQDLSDQEKFELRTLKRLKVESKKLPNPPKKDVFIILLYLKEIIEKDYDIQSIGKAFELARDNLKEIILQSKFMWEIGKYANLFSHEEPNLALSQKEKVELLDKVNIWIEKAIKQEDEFIKKND
jgi:hypothetical protein